MGERLAVLLTEDLLNFLRLNLSWVVPTQLAGKDIAACDIMLGLCGEGACLLSGREQAWMEGLGGAAQ